MKLLIATPSYRDPKRGFTYSLVSLCMTLMSLKYEHGKDIDFDMVPFENTSDIALGRNLIAEYAINNKYDYLLCIDDDTEFKPEAFMHLWSRRKDVIAANYMKKGKREPVSSTNGQIVYSKDKTGIEKITQTGCGFMLINVNVFKKLPKPYYESRVYINGTDMKASSEAVYFCELLEKNGIELYIDHDAAKHVWHLTSERLQE